MLQCSSHVSDHQMSKNHLSRDKLLAVHQAASCSTSFLYIDSSLFDETHYCGIISILDDMIAVVSGNKAVYQQDVQQ